MGSCTSVWKQLSLHKRKTSIMSSLENNSWPPPNWTGHLQLEHQMPQTHQLQLQLTKPISKIAVLVVCCLQSWQSFIFKKNTKLRALWKIPLHALVLFKLYQFGHHQTLNITTILKRKRILLTNSSSNAILTDLSTVSKPGNTHFNKIIITSTGKKNLPSSQGESWFEFKGSGKV